MLSYQSVWELVEAASQQEITISRLVLQDQAALLEQSEKELYRRMRQNLLVMQSSAERGVQPDVRSISGLTGGDAYRMLQYRQSGSPLGGNFAARANTIALAVAEYNAAMGKIVAAPTAGSCGILPAALLSMMEERRATEEQTVMALITAGALGLVIATESSISGAEGGCQAECGSAAAMAAGALVELAGGTPDMVGQACAIALKNQLGLTCDPVAGLVEVPCIKRNVGGIGTAISACDMALAGIRSVIPVDEVIAAMREVGDAMPASLRETSLGGLAVTPTAQAIQDRIFGKE